LLLEGALEEIEMDSLVKRFMADIEKGCLRIEIVYGYKYTLVTLRI
jgi:hypothetical protein